MVPATAVYIYTACGLSKRSAAKPFALSRVAPNSREIPIAQRADAWVRKAWADTPHRNPFELTYQGGFWGLLRKNPPPSHIKICAVSAGFGVLTPGSLIPNYDATFSKGSRNSVGGSSPANREWWTHLGRHAKVHGRPSGITDSVQRFCGIHIVALPQIYLDAVWDDISEVLCARRAVGRIVILTTPYSGNTFASGRSLTVAGGLRAELGGTIGTLLPRFALRIASTLGESCANFNSIRRLVSSMATEDALSPERKRMTDDDVQEFIADYLKRNPSASGYTRALRQLRTSGLACEMKRFRSLFQSTQELSRYEPQRSE